MKTGVLPLLAILGASIAVAGCGHSEDVEAAKLKQGYEKKNYTLDDVPPAQRGIVEGFMKGAKKSPPAVGAAPVSSPTSKEPSNGAKP